LTSTDLLTDSLSLSATATLHKAGTTTGLDSIQYERLEVPTSGGPYDIIDATSAGANKANKIYISNKATDNTLYVDVYIASLNIGRLYAGDWAFFPLEAAAATQDVGVAAVGGAQVIEFALFHEGKTLVAS
jgi:hypothetical protein